MKTGSLVDLDGSFDDVVTEVINLQAAGVATVWASQIFAMDALTVLGAISREVPGMRLGTAVIPVHPRHPVVLATQALTVQAISKGKLELGIGLSHKPIVERVFGESFDKPAGYMNEYLSILMPLLREKAVSFSGDRLRSRTFGSLEIDADPPSVLVAALGATMLDLAGRLTDGTITWMTGPKTIREHIAPTIEQSARNANRASPRVVVGLPLCVTRNKDKARAEADRKFGAYGSLPSYRAMLEREGVASPGEVAIIGSSAQVRSQLLALEEAGATEFFASPFGTSDERKASFDVLATVGFEGS